VVPLSVRPIISIVDDDDSIRVAAGDLVTSLGFVALTFASAEAFLQSGDATRTSCLITDIQLPGMSGLDLQDRLRAEGYRLPVIVITAFPEPKLKRRAEAAGAVAFLVKPFDGRELIARIEEVLSRDEGPSKP
jgi:FixJ family two-component response regulator